MLDIETISKTLNDPDVLDFHKHFLEFRYYSIVDEGIGLKKMSRSLLGNPRFEGRLYHELKRKKKKFLMSYLIQLLIIKN